MSPHKRAHEEFDEAESLAPTRNIRPKTDAAAQAAIDANSDSSYVSAAAAIFSEDEADGVDATGPSDVDSESDLSTSSEEPSSASDDSEEESDADVEAHEQDNGIREGARSDDSPVAEEERINLRPGRKPIIKKTGTDDSLLRKLQAFLPEMEQANDILEQEREEGKLAERNIEACEEGKSFIEMNLGLGVLEEKPEGWAPDNEDVESEDADDEGEEDNVMSRLRGEERGKSSKPRIEIMAGS